MRKLEFLLADALSKGADTVITCGGIQSNHCRATAFACAQLGLQCHLILRNDPGYQGDSSAGLGNHFLDQLSGATIELYEPKNYARNLDSLFDNAEKRFSAQGHQSYCIPTGGSNGLGVWGYIQAVEELQLQLQSMGIEPDFIVCASGSGGTQAGLTLGAHLRGVSGKVIGMAVCDSADYFDQKVRADVEACARLSGSSEQDAISLSQHQLDVRTIDGYIGPGYAKADSDIYQCIREMACEEGLMLDPTYTGKAFFGMLKEIEQGQFSSARDIVFVHTGGGFGLFPHAAYYTSP